MAGAGNFGELANMVGDQAEVATGVDFKVEEGLKAVVDYFDDV